MEDQGGNILNWHYCTFLAQLLFIGRKYILIVFLSKQTLALPYFHTVEYTNKQTIYVHISEAE